MLPLAAIVSGCFCYGEVRREVPPLYVLASCTTSHCRTVSSLSAVLLAREQLISRSFEGFGMSKRVPRSTKANIKAELAKGHPDPAKPEIKATLEKVETLERKPSIREQRVCILVLGAYRSGTSVLTRIIGFLGPSLPRRRS